MLNFVKSFSRDNFQLDIVGFLAILGEGSLEPIAQVATLSHFVYLPRLLPAPQVFIRPSRPEKLEGVSTVKVVGIQSGNTATEIHHVAHALHRGDKLPHNSVKLVRVTERNELSRPSVRTLGPLTALALLGFSMSAALFGLSIHYHDGMALLATIFLSMLSTLTGWSNKWHPTPNAPEPDPNSPPGDVVIRYPQGAFIVVLCDERTARYLYFNPSEKCVYTIGSSPIYRLLSLVGTLLLMGGVICLANSGIELQSGFAASYMLLNIFYWIVAALPPARHWDLSRLRVSEINVKGGFPTKGRADATTPTTYTEALWKAIAITRFTGWVKEAVLAPKTPAWEEWLIEAKEAANREKIEKSPIFNRNTEKQMETWSIPSWDAKGALGNLLKTETRANPV
ncbi:hypothetical protein GJ744_001499 [Endocarpon pusillum]|uniref:Uncharacterized protein n=1 Tax=Endocarpon pusillum TaxID=364733 RepID=A0A8H7E181_9EURO|nr:hypothetical protein GJ744_001499 [Endocarpon pusillum]